MGPIYGKKYGLESTTRQLLEQALDSLHTEMSPEMKEKLAKELGRIFGSAAKKNPGGGNTAKPSDGNNEPKKESN